MGQVCSLTSHLRNARAKRKYSRAAFGGFCGAAKEKHRSANPSQGCCLLLLARSPGAVAVFGVFKYLYK